MSFPISFRNPTKVLPGRVSVAVARTLVFSASVGLFAAAGGLIGDSAVCTAAERWTTLDGSRTVEAEFIGMWGNSVVLELPGSRRVSVSLDDLIAESRIQARRMGEDQQRRRAETRQQILADAKEAAAPAPTPLPKPTPPPAYQPPSTGAGLMSELEWFEIQEQNGHGLIAAFDLLPPSYQNDLERMLRASVAKMNMQGVSQLLGSVHSVGDLVVTRQRWIFSHPRLGAIDPDSVELLENVLLSLGGLIRDGIDPDQLKLNELATTPLRTWLVGLDQRIAPHWAAMNEQILRTGGDPSSYEVKEEKDGEATVEWSQGTAKQSIRLVTVEGKWMFDELNAEKWSEMIKTWETNLSETPDGSLPSGGQAMMISALIGPFVQQGLSAKSAREFHAVMDGWISMASPMVAPMMAQMNSRRRGGNSGYGMDDEYGMEEDYDDDYDQDMEGMDDEEGYGQ